MYKNKKINRFLATFLVGITSFSSLGIPALALEKQDSNLTVEYVENEVDGSVMFHLTKSIVNLSKNSDNKAIGDLGYYLTTEKGNYNTSNTEVEAIPTVTKLDKDKIVIAAEDDSSKIIDVNVLENESKKINDYTTAESRLYKNKLNLKETYSETENNKYAGDWTLESNELTSAKAGHYIGSVKALFNLDSGKEEENIPNTVYAKLCDENDDGDEDTLYLSNNLEFSCKGTLINNYNNKDNNTIQTQTGTQNPIWYEEEVEKIEILNKIKPISGYRLFAAMDFVTEVKNMDNLITSDITNMEGMFSGMKNILELDLSSFDTSKVTNMKNMFQNVGYKNTNFVLDLGNKFDTSNVTNMYGMFNYTGAKTIYVTDKFVTTNVTNSDMIFNYVPNLVGGNGTTYNIDYINDITYARIDKPGQPGYFTDRSVLDN